MATRRRKRRSTSGRKRRSRGRKVGTAKIGRRRYDLCSPMKGPRRARRCPKLRKRRKR